MRLLEEAPSTLAPQPSGQRVLATLSITLLVLVGAAFLGYTMLTAGGDDADANEPLELSAWVQEASATCLTVAEEHPVLTQGEAARLEPGNVAAVSSGVQALTTAIGDLPPLREPEEAGQVNQVVELGTPASEAWRSIKAADGAPPDALGDASNLTSTFVTGLVDLGAACAVLN